MTSVIQNKSLRELWKFRALPRDCMASGIGHLCPKPEHPQVDCAALILLVEPIVFALPLIRSMLRSTSSSLPAEF